MKNEAIVLCKLQVLLNYHTKYFQPSKSSKECNATGPEQVSRICALETCSEQMPKLKADLELSTLHSITAHNCFLTFTSGAPL